MRLTGAIVIATLAVPAAADTVMTAEEFEAWSTGQTLDYHVDGSYWGAEMHLPGRRTLDSDGEGICQEGRWYPEGDMICFTYEVSPGPHCWRFRRSGTSVLAELVGDADWPRTEVTVADQPLSCQGPDVGV